MPNHVRNKVKMTGIVKLPIFTTAMNEYRKKPYTFFDFNKLIPMPESLEIERGSIEKVAIEAVLRKIGKGRYSSLSDEEYENRKHGKTDEELEKIGLQYISNKVLYGHTNWYDWSLENWGTKWNSYDNVVVDEDTIEFSTAWSMPEPIMLKLSEMFPDIWIQHWWANEDMRINTGYREYHNGEITYEDYSEKYSTEAYDTYVDCWGETSCLYKDEEGNWQRYSCEECHGCD